MKLRRALGWAVMGLSLIGAGVFGAIRDFRYGGDLVWSPGYEKALAAAQAEHRRMLISFHYSGCDWCRKMDAETFTDPRVVALSHAYVCVRIDALRDPELIRAFHVSEFPTTVIANEHGKEVAHLDGFVEAARMAAAMRRGDTAN